MNRTFIFLLTAFFAFSNPLISGVTGVKKTILPNGIVILTKPVRTNGIVSVEVTSKMGSLYESDEDAGICMLMQSTLQKGTKTRNSEQIALELETMGTRLSAGSDREYGTIGMQTTSESLYKSLDILYDVILNAEFPQDALDLQKNLQARNLMLRYDQPIYKAMDLMVDTHYGKHPFHKPVMGYPESIKAITRDNVLKYYRTVYVPSNIVITFVGNFDEKEVLENVKNNLGPLKGTMNLNQVAAEMPEHKSPMEKTETRETAASWFAIGWDAPRQEDPDFYSMEMLNAITGGSMNSRLFVAIREQRGLAYQVSSFYNPRIESGLFVAYVGTKPETYEEAKKVLIDEVRKMGTEEPSAEEITHAKSYLKGMNIMSQESNSGQASQLGEYEILGLGYDFGSRYNENISKISAKDIIETGRKYLEENYTLGGVLAK